MRFLKSDRRIVTVLLVLSVTQLICWGTIGLPAVVGRDIAADLNITLPVVFAGSSVLYVAMALCAPWLAKAFTHLGARRVMMIGTVVAAPGFVLLSAAQGQVAYFAAWAILGMAGSATLSTGAYILVNEVAGAKAKSAIGALMLVTGLSSSIFWPTTSFLAHLAGWRGTCLIYAAMMIAVVLPLYAFCVPPRARATDAPAGEAAARRASPVVPGTFSLVVSAIALNVFVSVGLSAIFIELLKAEGLPPSQAVAFGSTLGIVQVSARGIDFLGGGRWDGITTGLVAATMLSLAMLFLMASGGSYWAVAIFILLYGAGSGALAVARATIPLVFYDKAAFAKATSVIALPLNLASAISPPVLAGLLTHAGSRGVLGLAALCSCVVVAILLVLSRRRPAIEPAGAV